MVAQLASSLETTSKTEAVLALEETLADSEERTVSSHPSPSK